MDEVSIGEFARRSRLSVKALRLYDELGILAPARVEESSGYRYYEAAQLESARLVAMLRQLDVPLAVVRELLACAPVEAAGRVEDFWRQAEQTHVARRALAKHLITQLSGKEPIPMYEVATRDMPERSLLCLKRNVDEQGAWDLGKEFVAIWRERPAPRIEGRVGAAFSIYWGQVSADSDGPVEWCRPVPTERAAELAEQYPELTLRSEPAHREAFVALSSDPSRSPAVEWQLAVQALYAWANEQGITPESLELTPEDLGIRVTYLASPPITDTSVPDSDFAVPFR